MFRRRGYVAVRRRSGDQVHLSFLCKFLRFLVRFLVLRTLRCVWYELIFILGPTHDILFAPYQVQEGTLFIVSDTCCDTR